MQDESTKEMLVFSERYSALSLPEYTNIDPYESLIRWNTSYAYIISHDGYNELVRELNEETLAKFPASILKYLTFTGNAEYYG